MEVKNNLPTLGIAVDNGSKPPLIDTLKLGNLRRRLHYGIQILLLAGLDFHHRGDMLFGNDDNMYRSHRSEIVEGQHLVVLVYLVARQFTSNYSAEYAIIHLRFHLFPAMAWSASTSDRAPEYNALPMMTPVTPNFSMSLSLLISSRPATPPEAITGMPVA